MNKMLEELAEVVRPRNEASDDNAEAPYKALRFIRSHHTTIAQNAEASKRLNALELAFAEVWASHKSYEIKEVVTGIEKRADEIMRGESNDLIRN